MGRDKLPQIWWLKVTYIYYLPVSEGQESGFSLAESSTQGLTKFVIKVVGSLGYSTIRSLEFSSEIPWLLAD